MKNLSPLDKTTVTIDRLQLQKDNLNMGLIRIIVIALIIYLVLQIFKRWAANKNRATSHLKETKMVRCKICQLHIPENEALQHAGEFYCSQEHLDKNSD